MLPDIDSIALFVRAAEMRSLTKAAEATNIGLAAASRRIALLEHRFKAQLFERTPRGVELTAAGAALLEHAKFLVQRMHQMQSEMANRTPGPQRNVLRIVASTSAIAQFLPEDLAEFEAVHPEIRLIVQERWSPEIANAIRNSDVDMGVVVEGAPLEDLVYYPYRSDRLALVAPSSHPLMKSPKRRGLSFESVLDYDFIGLERGSSMMKVLSDEAVRQQKVLRLKGEFRSFQAVGRAVQAGLGIGILPKKIAGEFASSMGLDFCVLEEPWATRNMLLVVRSAPPQDSPLYHLVEALRDL